ncbi:MAG: 23S rRNA (guanosine(2251)-2'-O)-methyltransferase RlmB [Eubacteriales bacterium]|nr:23S rRNA (guanosine(2251)-2'-O)-methyltransferase RlmB [Clostridia bacterium]MDY2846404.1 23S rRNA (guanosine(2251)-2'-O)-methyltransferase RlmB [Eubacteriales bacterium]
MEEKRFKNYDKKDRSTGRKNFSDNQGKSFNRPRQNRDDSKGRENAVVGRNAVAELLKTGTPIDKILVSGVEGSVKVIVAKAKEARIPVVDTTSDYLDRLCGGENHQGVAALVAEKAYCTVEDILEIARERGEKPLIVVCDGIEDPHNLGAVIRCAECEGAHGIIIPERRACGLTPAVSKASAGAIMHMAVAKVSNIAQTIEKLKENGVWTYAAEADGQDFYDTDFSGGCAIVLGGEDSGVSRLVRERCDYTVSIPMYGKLNSLNVSTAASVLLCHAARMQRIMK